MTPTDDEIAAIVARVKRQSLVLDEMEAMVRRVTDQHRAFGSPTTKTAFDTFVAEALGHHAGTMQGGHPDEIARLKEQTR